MSKFSLNLAIEQSAEQRNLGARAHLGSTADGNVEGDYVLDHGARFELVKRTSRELDAETGQETTTVGRSNDTRSDSSTVSQTIKGWSELNVEERSWG